MRNVLFMKNQSLSWHIKAILVLLLTVITTVVCGVNGADASISVLNQWPATPQIVSNAATGTVTGTVTVAAGTKRVMLIAVSSEYTAAPSSQTMTVTYGGVSAHQIQQTISGLVTTWLGFVDEHDIDVATSTTLSVTNGTTTNLVAMYAAAAVYDGVSQQSPFTGSSVASSTAAGSVASLALPSIAVAGAAGNTGLSVYMNAWNGQASTPFAGFTENVDYTGTNFRMAFNTVTTAYTARGTATITATPAAAAAGSAVAIGLNPDGIPGSQIITCAGCHGEPPVDGATRDPATGQFVGSHNKHFIIQSCTNCHVNNTTTNHSDGLIQIASPLRGVTGESYGQATHALSSSPTFSTCTTYCHSQGTSKTSNAGETRTTTLSSPLVALTWGTNNGTCASCHGNPPNYATGVTTWGAAKANTHSAHVTTNAYSCDVCHNATTTTGTSITTPANHANGVYNITANTAKTGTFTYTYAVAGGTCSSTMCHGSRTVTWGTTLAGTGCAKCHSSTAGATFTLTDGTTNTAKSTIHVSHVNKTHSMINTALTCAECHTVPGTNNAANHIDSALPAEAVMTSALATGSIATGTATLSPSFNGTSCSNVYCHGADLVSNKSPYTPPASVVLAPTFGTTLLTGTASNDCARCHGYPPVTATHTGYVAADCITCHPHVNSAGTGFTDLTKHINGLVESTASCFGCHKSVQNARVAVIGQFTSAQNSHHYQGTAKIDGTVCYACHWESDALGSTTSHHKEQTVGFKNKVQLVVWGTSTTRPTTYDATTYVLYSSGRTTASSRTELAKINNHCNGCHNDTNKTTATFAGDTGTPSKYSWEAKPTTAGGFGAAQSIASKYLSTATTPWGKYAGNNANAKNGQTKAYSAHGNANANQRGWTTTEEVWTGAVANFPNNSGTAQVLCFDCHNSHGSAASSAATNAVTSSYSSATGRGKGGLLKDVTAGIGGYAVSYRPYSGGNATQKNVYKAGAGLCFDCHNNAAAGAATSTGKTSPWGYNGTFGSSQIIHGYNDNPYFGKAGAAFPKGVTFPYLTAGGLTTNKGGHFGASSTLATSPTRQIGGLCTPCHDPHGVSPGITAANQQYAVPLLKGTYVTSPYKQDAAPANTNEVRGGGSTTAPLSVGSTIGYHIDQSTMQAASTGKPATARYWAFATSASTLQTLNATQFAGLCTQCHTQTALNNTAAVTTANWKTMTRVHNAVNGWAVTGGTGGNAGNKVHAYTCSKCHSSHNSNLPRLLVTNCLDVKHRGRVTSGTNTGLLNTATGSRGQGLGRFPGGGSYGHSRNATTATNPGPWFFGKRTTTAVTTANLNTTQTCHDSATAGGTWNTTGVSQQWNTKSLW